ncbi:MAG: hypothetical protein D6730_11165 [Bacteroidetes bacterium]|nr:MAG: hypothetical protein D6730_11165 [Bacteroidota bacterium]
MKTYLKRYARWAAVLLLLGMMSGASAQSYRSYSSERATIQALESELADLQSMDVRGLDKRERKAIKRKKRLLKKRIDRLYYSEWRRVQASNPYARNHRHDGAYRYGYPYYGRYYRPHYPIRRIYIIRR